MIIEMLAHLDQCLYEHSIFRPVTAPETQTLQIQQPQQCPRFDVSVLFQAKVLTGKQVSWPGVRHTLASLGRPSTLTEVCDTVWRMYRDYCDQLGPGLGPHPRSDKFTCQVQNIVDKYLSSGNIHSAQVGGEGGGVVYYWLDTMDWPDEREQEAWRRYRTVHQAVRCAIQEMVDTGERYNGVFAQVKRIHDYVQENTNFTKKQVREVLLEVQQSLQKYFVPAKVSNINKSPSLGFLSSKTLPWNYGVGGKTKGICSSSQGPNRKLCEENKEKEMRHSMSMIDINELTKLLNTSNRSTVNNSYLDLQRY